MIDLSKCYLHSISKGYYDIENAGIKLKSILINGGIYSRRLQLEKLKQPFYEENQQIGMAMIIYLLVNTIIYITD